MPSKPPHYIHTIPGNTKLQWAALAGLRPSLRTLTANNTWLPSRLQGNFFLLQLHFFFRIQVWPSSLLVDLSLSTTEAVYAICSSISDISPGSGHLKTCRAAAIHEGSGSLPSVARLQPLSILSHRTCEHERSETQSPLHSTNLNFGLVLVHIPSTWRRAAHATCATSSLPFL